MNYLNVIEVINRMNTRLLEAKLVTYTRKFKDNIK